MLASLDEAYAARRSRAGRSLLRRLRSGVLVALAGCGALLALHTPALAHARLERSSPAAGAVLATSPATVELKFNELLDEEFNAVEVFRAKRDGTPADEQNLTTGKARVDAADQTRLTTDLGPLAPGAYVVQWKVLSRDGHSARGRVLFRIGAE